MIIPLISTTIDDKNLNNEYQSMGEIMSDDKHIKRVSVQHGKQSSIKGSQGSIRRPDSVKNTPPPPDPAPSPKKDNQ